MDFKTYIKNVVNENKKEQYIINEAKTHGLFDSLFNSKNKETKDFLISFGSLFSLFTGEATKTELALQKVCQDRKKDAQKRLDNIKKAKDKAKAAQIKAKYALEKNQADIRAKRKIDAFNALEKKYKRMQTFYKGNIFEFGPEERAMREKQLEDSFKALVSGKDLEAAEKIKAYKDVLMFKEDGTRRSQEELKTFVAGDEGKNILEKLQGYKNIDEKLANYTTQNAGNIWDELSQMEEYTPPMDIEEANKQLEAREKDVAALEKKIKIHDKVAQYDDQIKKAQDTKNEKEKLKNGINENDGKYSINDDFYGENVLTNCIKTDEAGNKSFNKDKLKDIAKSLGVSDSNAFADAVEAEFGAGETGSIDEGNLKKNINKVFEKDEYQKDLKKTKTKADSDYQKAKDDEQSLTEEKNSFIDSLPKGEYSAEMTKEQLESDKKDAISWRSQLEKQKANIESVQEANKNRVQEAKTVIEKTEEEDSYDDDMKTALKKEREVSTLEPGEEWDDKKQEAGYRDKDDNWIPRPKDSDEQNDYKKGLDEKNIYSPLQGKKELTYTYDKKTGKFKDKEGNIVEGDDNIKKAKETYIKEKVYNEKISQSKGTLEQQKVDLLDKYTEIVDKDGKVNKKKYENLSDDDKNEFEKVINGYENIIDLGNGEKIEGGNYGRFGKVSKNKNEWKYRDEEGDDEDKDKEKEKKDGKKDEENTGGQGGDEDDTEDLEDTEYDEEEDIDDDESDEDDEDLEKEEIDGKKKIRHPGKIWKRRKNVRTGEPTERYYRNGKKDGDTITQEEFQKKVSAFEKRKNKKSQGGGTTDKNSFSGYIKGQLINETKSNYGKFRQYLKEILK
jgi:hypothetical protein